jgi:hypothetical protein
MGSSGIGAASGMCGPLELLGTAFDAGIRHFDTAPLYGLGRAERCLGEFIARHKKEVTITTKYGLQAPKFGRVRAIAARLANPLIVRAQDPNKAFRQSAEAPSSNDPEPAFTVEAARATLENSLRELKTERIQIWLLHEATADRLNDEKLLRFMEDSVRQGKIGAFGVGGAAWKMQENYATRSEYCSVIQCEWDALEPKDRFAEAFRVRFQVLRCWPARVLEHMKLHPDDARRWSDEVGMELTAPGTLSALTLRAALLSNANGIVLFESRNKLNITKNAQTARDASLDRPALCFHALLNREGPSILRQTVNRLSPNCK